MTAGVHADFTDIKSFLPYSVSADVSLDAIRAQSQN